MSTKFLDDAIEVLNAALLEAEVALRRLQTRVPAKVPLSPGWLSWEKFQDKWQLVYRAENNTPQPLANTTRDVRLKAAEQLPVLREAMFDAIDVKFSEIERATAMTRTFIEDTLSMCQDEPEASE